MKTLLSMGVLAFIVGMFLAPVALIWSLNTLFPALAIPVTLETYFAAMFLAFTVSSTKGQ
jgi:hypothetical protein